jgi:hypothetical protein
MFGENTQILVNILLFRLLQLDLWFFLPVVALNVESDHAGNISVLTVFFDVFLSFFRAGVLVFTGGYGEFFYAAEWETDGSINVHHHLSGNTPARIVVHG